MLERFGIPSEFPDGLRVTIPEAMESVRMVLVALPRLARQHRGDQELPASELHALMPNLDSSECR